MRNAVCTLICLVLAPICQARTITVDNDAPADFNNIQEAINDANNGDTVEIQPGTYTGPGNRDIDFLGKPITVRSTNPNDPNIVARTIIDCNAQGRAFYFYTQEDANSVVAGLTITNGNASFGAGVLCELSNPLITNCTFTNGNASEGAAVYCLYSSPLITNCTFTNNTPTRQGVIFCTSRVQTTITKCTITGNIGTGIYCDERWPPDADLTITECIITNNSGDGLDGCFGTITNCTITGNSGAGVSGGGGTLTNCNISRNGSGGGILYFGGDISNCFISENSSSGIANSYGTISDCTIVGNVAHRKASGLFASGGGGIRCADVESMPITKILNCVIAGNTATGHGGGGIFCSRRNPEIVNCLITRNQDTEGINGGGGIACIDNSSPIIRNCTITQNATSRLYGSGIYCEDSCHPTLINSIVWGNVGWGERQIDFGGRRNSTVTISWSSVQGGPSAAPSGCNWGEGNIDTDPRLTSNGRLMTDSPCIDAADPAYVPTPLATDIDGEQRIYNNRLDMGADEFIDTDRDGLPDWWENKHFGSPTDAEPTGNPDNDTWPNAEEYPAGSDPANSSDYYVNPADGNDSWDGLAPARDGEHGPKQTIQAAVDACPAGLVTLAPAIYTGDGNRDIDLRGKPVTVSSIDPRDPDIVAATIIDCQGSAAQPHRGFHLHTNEGPYSTIAGLTITGGHSTTSGGAVWADLTAPTITRCSIIGNHASSGGGIHAAGRIENCIIADNTATYGGGISIWPGIARITDCLITNNSASTGGAIDARLSHISISNCAMSGNKASKGSAVYASSTEFTLANSTITCNHANSSGAVHLHASSTATLANTILWANTAPLGPQIALFNNFGADPPIASVSYSDIQGGKADVYINYHRVTLNWGDGNIDADPCFADPGYWRHVDDPNIQVAPTDPNAIWADGDYHLKSQAARWDPNSETWLMDDVTSPCIDAGDPMTPIGPEPFPNGGIVNIGAHAATPEASKSYFNAPPCESIVAGDVNGDCIVDFNDFRFIALHWMRQEN